MQTVRNRLREVGLRARRPYFGRILWRQHRGARVGWCNTVRNWTLRNWRRIWLSGESRFMLQHRDGRVRVYRRKNKRFANNCVVEVDRISGVSVMMWGAISYNQRTSLVLVPGNLTAQRYHDKILQPHLLPVINTEREVFQHDNARPHTERAIVDFLADHNVTVLPWPSGSLDFNPIEHLLDQLDKRVRRRQPAPQTLLQLQQALHEEWQRIPQVQIQRSIQSMRRRVTTVLQANGGHTRY